MEDFLELVGGGVGWVVGIGITLGAASLFSPATKPVAKKVIKGYLTAADRVRVLAAEAGENIQDLYAEAKMEYESTRTQSSAESPIVVPGRGA